jgi:predicted 3-demethylubiquinone-9 3-methyltransferase (glyoxalase superfamily)
MKKLTTCLWFDGRAEEAAKFYTSIFKGSKLGDVVRYGESGPGAKGSVMTVTFELLGQEFMGLNGGPEFKFNPSVSFMVPCETQKDVDYYWEKLLQGGSPQECGWLTDRFGVSWQVVPTVVFEMMKDKDAAKRDRVMKAVMSMVKLDVETLKAAYEGAEVAAGRK